MRQVRVVAVFLSLVVAACGGTTAEVTIETRVENFEGGTFTASGDLFECAGRWATEELHLNEGDTWWFQDEFVCSDGSGTLVILTEGDGPEPDPGESVGTWTVVSGTGDYEGFSGEGTYDLSISPWAEHREGELTSG